MFRRNGGLTLTKASRGDGYGRAVGSIRFKDLCVDAHDPAAVGRFWQTAIGGQLEVMADGDAVLSGGPLHAIWLNVVPEPKVVKNRVHLDVRGDPDRLVEVGASLLAEHDGWSVLADPDGNEFCAFDPRR